MLLVEVYEGRHDVARELVMQAGVAAAPADWLPWNYEDALARLDQRRAQAA